MRKARRLVILLTAAIFLYNVHGAMPAEGQVRYVAPGGSCGGASPCYAAVQAAVEAAAGDEIRVATGNYTGTNTLGGLSQIIYLTKSLTLRGGYTTANWNIPDPVANPATLDAGDLGRVIAVIGPAEVVIEGLTLTGGNAAGLRGDPNNPTTINCGGAVYIRSANVTLRKISIKGNTASKEASKPGLGGGLYAYASNLVLSDSRVEANLASPVYYGSGGGLYFDSCPAVTVSNSLIQDNTGSTNQANAGGGNGGGICIQNSSVLLDGNTIYRNTGTTGPGGLSSASGGGVYAASSSVTLTKNIISDNIASLKNAGWGGGLAISYGSTAHLEDNIIQGNTASSSLLRTGQGGGVYFAGNSLTMNRNGIRTNTASGGTGQGYGGGVFLTGGNASLAGNMLTYNQAGSTSTGEGGGLYVEDSVFRMDNNIVAGNGASTRGSGLLVSSSANPGHLGQMFYTTIADNTGSGEGVHLANRARLALTNSIIAGHASAGITATLQSSVSHDSTLWHGNGNNTIGPGTITPLRDYTGDPAFAAPLSGDYHIAATSAALDRGVATQVAADIEGQSRPNGAASDLGADEYYLPSGTTTAEKIAFAPQWFATFNPLNGQFRNYLNQRYLLQFKHFDPAGLAVSVTDTLPPGLAFGEQRHAPAMIFSQQGPSLSWQTQQALPAGQTAQILLTAISDQFAPGETITNQAEVRAGSWQFNPQATSQVPLVPPLITAPGPGEICPGALQVTGIAVPNTTITLYMDGEQVAVASAAANGAFSASISPAGLGVQRRVLTAKACTGGSPGQCSALSHAVTLDPPLTFICPQPSTWEHIPASGPLAGQQLVYRFRNQNGLFVGDGAHFSFVPPHAGSSMHLYARSCEQMGTPPVTSEAVWVDVYEGLKLVATYHPQSISKPWYHFTIGMELADGVERDVIARLGCVWPGAPTSRIGAPAVMSSTFSAVLNPVIDQGGTVFDVTRGFDPAHPEQSAVTGVKVTAMILDTAWGGWVPWPAHLYNNQANPQVTGANGYYAFFAPPGVYYLQVDGGAGYYDWRSPPFQVSSAPLHVNIPLSPRLSTAQRTVLLSAAGPTPPVVRLPIGQSIEWSVALDSSLSLTDSMRLADNPTIRLQTTGALDPLLNPQGWDAGMLVPGSFYRRQFNRIGTFHYTDGRGLSGTVIVDSKLYLPIIGR